MRVIFTRGFNEYSKGDIIEMTEDSFDEICDMGNFCEEYKEGSNPEFDKKLIELGFKEYIHQPTGFKAWSISDLCTSDEGKDWF